MSLLASLHLSYTFRIVQPCILTFTAWRSLHIPREMYWPTKVFASAQPPRNSAPDSLVITSPLSCASPGDLRRLHHA